MINDQKDTQDRMEKSLEALKEGILRKFVQVVPNLLY